jgi:hypothetical protein
MKRSYWVAYRLSSNKGKTVFNRRQVELCRKAERWFQSAGIAEKSPRIRLK